MSNQEVTLRTFHNDPKVKRKYLNRLKLHAKHDELIKRQYWENGKGCAIGCILHSNKHKNFETELGLPEWLAHLFDFLFENLDNGKAKEFPIAALSAIPVGVNLQKTYHKFCIFLLTEICQFETQKYPNVKKAIDDKIQLHAKAIQGEMFDTGAWSAAWSAAEAAAWAASESAAWSAKSAARSAAWSAWAAARSAKSASRSAARSAAWSAWAAARSASESASRSASESAAIEKIANKIIQLLKEADT